MEEIDEPFGRRSAKLIDVLWRGARETAIGRLCRIGAAQGVSNSRLMYVTENMTSRSEYGGDESSDS